MTPRVVVPHHGIDNAKRTARQVPCLRQEHGHEAATVYISTGSVGERRAELGERRRRTEEGVEEKGVITKISPGRWVSYLNGHRIKIWRMLPISKRR